MTQPRQTLRPSLRPVLEAYVSVTGTAYTAKAGDRVIGVNRSGAVTVTLPTAQLRPGRIYTVKDESGAAATNNITVATEGSETIDGSATDVINIDYESKSYYSDGTNWFILPVTPDTNTQLTLATTVSTQAHGDSAAPGSATTASKGDHKHAMPAAASGTLKQFVSTQTGSVATGTTLIPDDDTIPQNTEGDEYMTLAITPQSTSNKLVIEVTVTGGPNTAERIAVALFQDSTANALAAEQHYQGSSETFCTTFTHVMTAGTTSSTTFKVRIGRALSGTYTFNGYGSARRLGGVIASGIRIWEVAP